MYINKVDKEYFSNCLVHKNIPEKKDNMLVYVLVRKTVSDEK